MQIRKNRYFQLAQSGLLPYPNTTITPISEPDECLKIAKEGFDLFTKREWKEAHVLYSRAIESYPDQPFFRACRSVLNAYLEDDEGAFYDYQVVKTLDANYCSYMQWQQEKPANTVHDADQVESVEALLEAALEFTPQFDYERALAYYAEAFRRAPSADTLVYAGALQVHMLRYENAFESFAQALQIDRGNASAYLYRAKLFSAIREFDNATQDLDKAVELAPQSSAVYEERGNFFVEREQYEKAAVDFNILIALLPEDFYVYALRADLFEKMENWESALADYGEAIVLNPTYSELYLYRSNVREQLGDARGAAEDLDTFHRLDKRHLSDED
ncbi:tetratricopeptide repeat protein [Sphingobacterium paludis]|uniref:Tetratricopeptide repeat protein n=1 Tax=Sphingobacterium paludis TaxID=1476465 RepID=A0A4R7D0L6_9SPHI|nr:hypothetical protein [Sphingobacterium paludis]TDS13014.1 hypothetical protein B0I21_105146 [Sphingobacterium paludis]